MFEINGEYWQIKFVHPRDRRLIRTDGVLTAGACDNTTKTIYINETIRGSFFQRVLCHEISHAVMLSYNITLTDEQTELVAQVMAKFGNEIIEITNKLFNTLKGRLN